MSSTKNSNTGRLIGAVRLRSRFRTGWLVAVDDDADVYTDKYECEDDATKAETEGKVGSAAGFTRPHLGGNAVSGSDRRAALGRAQNGKDADQPATAHRHEDRVTHVVVGWILQRALHTHQPASDIIEMSSDVECHVAQCVLTLSSPVVSNGYTTKCSKPYWSNPPFLFF